MLHKLGPLEYQKHARRAMELLGWNDERKLNAQQADQFNRIVWAFARSERRERTREAAVANLGELCKEVLKGLVEPEKGATSTPIEDLLFHELQATHLRELGKREFRIGPYRIDIAFPTVRLAIECDGRDYHTSPADRERDQNRDDYLAKLGWRVKRFRGRDIYHAVDECARVVLSEHAILAASK